MVDKKTLAIALIALASCSWREDRGILRVDHPSEGLRLLREGQTEEARARLEHERAMGNRNPHVAWGLGRAYAMEGLMKLARREFERALLIDPAMVEARFDLAELDYEEGLLEDCLLKVEAPPLSEAASWNRCLVLMKLQRPREALAESRHLVGMGPEVAAHWELHGLTALACGETTDARLGFERLIRLQPDNACARGNLEAIHRGGAPCGPTRDFGFRDAMGAMGWMHGGEGIPGDRSRKGKGS